MVAQCAAAAAPLPCILDQAPETMDQGAQRLWPQMLAIGPGLPAIGPKKGLAASAGPILVHDAPLLRMAHRNSRCKDEDPSTYVADWSVASKHLLGWAIFLAWTLLSDGDTFRWPDILLPLTHTAALAVAFYLPYALFWKRIADPPKVLMLLAAFVLCGVVFSGARMLLQEVLLRATVGFGNYNDPYQMGYLRDNIYRPLPVVLASLLVWQYERRAKARLEQERLQQEKAASELAFLRSQINPHFLFNTLGFIHSKTYAQAPEVAEIIEQLSTILRQAIVASPQGTLSIQEEWACITALNGIFEKRYPGQCHVCLELEGPDGEAPGEALMAQRIEPLLLMTFAENLYKHENLRHADDPALIRVHVDHGRMKATLINRIDSGKPALGTGIGLANAQKRLEMVYGQQHQLTFGAFQKDPEAETDTHYRVHLELKTNTSPSDGPH